MTSWCGARAAAGAGQDPGAKRHRLVRRRHHRPALREVLDREFFDTGFVQQHILHATSRAAKGGAAGGHGGQLGDDGLIRRIDEYLDPAELAPLL